MKIALLLTGFARKYSRSFISIKEHLLNNYDVDIYIASWDKIEQKYNPHLVKAKPKTQNLINLSTDNVRDFYGDFLVDYKFNKYDEYYRNRFENIALINRENDVFKIDEQAKNLGSFWIERLRDQWYIVQQCWNLVSNKEQYDIFFRMRFDIYLLYFRLKKDLDLVLPTPEFPDFLITDYLAYGNYETMNKYCNMFDHIETLYTKYNVNIAASEIMLNFYLKEYCKINYHIDKGLVYKRLKR